MADTGLSNMCAVYSMPIIGDPGFREGGGGGTLMSPPSHQYCHVD